MLTIDEIKEVRFRTGKGNTYYKADDVDAFIDEVVETFEAKNNEKAELVHKMDILATRIEQYRADEETVRNALLSAQKVADTTLKDANEQSEVIIKNAEAKAEKLIKDAQNKVAKEKEALNALQTLVSEMRTEIFSKVKGCIDLVSALPAEKNVAEIKAKLDREFPTPKADAFFDKPVEEESVEEVKEPAKEEPVEKPESIEDEVVAPVTENTTKFGVLKFGSNYDVDE
jgi:cell division initiation protein